MDEGGRCRECGARVIRHGRPGAGPSGCSIPRRETNRGTGRSRCRSRSGVLALVRGLRWGLILRRPRTGSRRLGLPVLSCWCARCYGFGAKPVRRKTRRTSSSQRAFVPQARHRPRVFAPPCRRRPRTARRPFAVGSCGSTPQLLCALVPLMPEPPSRDAVRDDRQRDGWRHSQLRRVAR